MKFQELYEGLITEDLEVNNAILEYYAFCEAVNSNEIDVLEEGIGDQIGSLLSKGKIKAKDISSGLGIKASKSHGRGLIQYLIAAGTNVTKLMIAAYKAHKQGTPEAKEALKGAIKALKIEKHELIDFLLRLDQATLHLVTGPLHLIDALTGWHIWADIKHHAEETGHKIKVAFNNMINSVTELPGKVKELAISKLQDIKTTLNSEGIPV